MQIDFKKNRFFLRIVGVGSLVIYFIFRIIDSDIIYSKYFLYFSVLCFIIILFGELTRFLGKHYFKS